MGSGGGGHWADAEPDRPGVSETTTGGWRTQRTSRSLSAPEPSTTPMDRRTLLRALGFSAALGPISGAAPDAPREVALLTTPVAGFQFGAGMTAGDRLREDVRLRLAREPQNPHDADAVAILLEGVGRVGYVPRYRNEPVVALLEAGVQPEAVVTRYAPEAPPPDRLEVAVVVQI